MAELKSLRCVTDDITFNMLNDKPKTLLILAPEFKPRPSFKVDNSESDVATALLTYKPKTASTTPLKAIGGINTSHYIYNFSTTIGTS
ncbi:hypothetical protein PSTT_05685 [Puccinia striiformis]|uniref:Uncharacterized protein n=1 Tax=Puccinia striiformis TaxID=27350 RepID=A0A2S4VN07_9BASI|nr:hypothetical protein PSTT_05685 [Puccinia striiformis]